MFFAQLVKDLMELGGIKLVSFSKGTNEKSQSIVKRLRCEGAQMESSLDNEGLCTLESFSDEAFHAGVKDC